MSSPNISSTQMGKIIYLDFQYEENNFNILTKFNMTSDYITAPPFQLQIIRDFSKSEKQIAFVLKEPSETGNVSNLVN